MKLLLENWREYLNENVDVEGWGSIPSFGGKALRTVILPPAPRLVVIVKTSSHGPTAFYQSTGTGTSASTEGMWVPFGGIGSYKGNPWIIKNPAGKMPKPGTELYLYGEWLMKSYEQRPFPEVLWRDWIQTKGYPTYQEVEKLTNGEVERIEYGAMIVNMFLNRNKALKKGWCSGGCEGFMGSGDKIPGKKYTLRDLIGLKK